MMSRCSEASESVRASLSVLTPEEILYVVNCALTDCSANMLQDISQRVMENLFYRLQDEHRTSRDYAGALSLAARDALRPAYRAKIIECLLDSDLHKGTEYEGHLKAELNKLCEDPSVVEYLRVVTAR